MKVITKVCPRCGKTFKKRTTSKYCSHLCSGSAPKTDFDYHMLAFQNAYSWVGILPKNSHTNTQWRCSKGHIWEATYNSVLVGNGCKYCSGHYKRTAQDYELLARQRGFTWAGSLPNKSSHNTLWVCNTCKYEWKASYANIVNKKSGCPNCAGQVRITLDEYHALADIKGLNLISEMPKNANSLATWECYKGHQFTRAYSNLKSRESSCPWCGDFVNGKLVSKPQRELHKMIGGELNYRVGNYAIDVAFLDTKIAIEYDCWYWHDLERDSIKDETLFKKGWKVIRIKAGVMIPTLDEFNNAVDTILSGHQMVTITLSDYKMPQIS